jgi:hypothetical protein
MASAVGELVSDLDLEVMAGFELPCHGVSVTRGDCPRPAAFVVRLVCGRCGYRVSYVCSTCVRLVFEAFRQTDDDFFLQLTCRFDQFPVIELLSVGRIGWKR